MTRGTADNATVAPVAAAVLLHVLLIVHGHAAPLWPFLALLRTISRRLRYNVPVIVPELSPVTLWSRCRPHNQHTF